MQQFGKHILFDIFYKLFLGLLIESLATHIYIYTFHIRQLYVISSLAKINLTNKNK